MQRTIAHKASFAGVGLHSGTLVEGQLLPADEDYGLRFVRSDCNLEIPATWEHIVDGRLATTLGVDGAQVATVEHLLAACFGMGLDNCRMELSAAEVPAMDGSAAAFAFLLEHAGWQEQSKARQVVIVQRPVKVEAGDSFASLVPSKNGLSIHCEIDFPSPVIGRQSIQLENVAQDFAIICQARTFGHLSEVEAMRAHGLALGGALDNAVVVGDSSVINAEGLRYDNEFARHKALDALGDLALIGAGIVGHFHGHRSGHALHHRLIEKLLSSEENFSRMEASAL